MGNLELQQASDEAEITKAYIEDRISLEQYENLMYGGGYLYGLYESRDA
jgi:hypothetical protein